MTINQISIFLENKYGKLKEVLSHLSNGNVRVIAATVADTSDYGILRVITSDQQKAYSLLKENKISANLTPVIALEIEPCVDEFSKTIGYFTEGGIDIEYMYCFSISTKAMLVLHIKNLEAAYSVIRKNNLNYIQESELINL